MQHERNIYFTRMIISHSQNSLFSTQLHNILLRHIDYPSKSIRSKFIPSESKRFQDISEFVSDPFRINLIQYEASIRVNTHKVFNTNHSNPGSFQNKFLIRMNLDHSVLRFIRIKNAVWSNLSTNHSHLGLIRIKNLDFHQTSVTSHEFIDSNYKQIRKPMKGSIYCNITMYATLLTHVTGKSTNQQNNQSKY